MKFNIALPQDIYASHLEVVNEIKFTRREIDTIAYLLSGKSAKNIANCLSISPKTIEAHMRNIMMKVECNSRDGIIDFIEKSKKIPLLKEHYLSLLIQCSFEAQLSKIAVQLGSEKPHCVIVYWRDQEYRPSFIHYLEKHLKLAGIKTVVETRESRIISCDPVNNKESWKNKLIIYAITASTLDHINKKGGEIIPFIQKIRKTPNSLVALLPSKDIKNDSLQNCDNMEGVHNLERENYYHFVFAVLKRLLPNIAFDQIILDFKSHYKSICEISETPHKQLSQEDEPLLSTNPPSQWNGYINIRKLKERPLFISSIIGLGVFCIGFLTLIGNKEGESKQNQEWKSNVAARADLSVPAYAAFLDRPQLIEKINESFKKPHDIQTIALVGIGGAGKTTLARYYARQQKANVVWEFDAESEEELNNSFEKLADALSKSPEEKEKLKELRDIKDAKERERKITLFVRDKLQKLSDWILIYDNVEKFTDIQNYFPHDPNVWGTGKVILITRDNNIGNNNNINEVIQVGELSPEEKLALFAKIMINGNSVNFTSTQSEQAKKFLNDVPPFPLDVSIAAYYLKTTNVPYEKYLEHLKDHNRDFIAVEEGVLKEVTDYTKTRYGIITLSLKDLMETHKDFGDLLLFVSLLDNQHIPRDLLNAYKRDTIVENFIYNLKKYSFITSESPISPFLPSTFSVHPSTQEISLKYLMNALNLTGHTQRLKQISSKLEDYIDDATNREDLPRMRILVNHCERILSHKDLLNRGMRGSLGGKLGYVYYYLNDHKKAKQILEESLSNLDKGENYDAIAHILMYLGDVESVLGNHEKAKSLCEQSLAIYKQHFSPYHMGIARALAYLGNVHRRLGNFEKAKDLCEQSLVIYEKNAPKNPTKVAWVQAHLGITYKELGDYNKAKTILEESLATYKHHFSENHARVAWVLAHLGNVYGELSNYKEAKNLLEQSLVVYRQHFSENHVRIGWGVGWVLFLLGNTYKNLGDYEKAKSFLEQSRAIYEKNYGQGHTEIARVLRSLGQVYLLEGHTETAENFLNQALKIFEQNKHPESYTSLENLSDLYLKKSIDEINRKNIQQSNNYKEQAASYLKQAQGIAKAYLPANAPQIIRIQSKLKELEKELE